MSDKDDLLDFQQSANAAVFSLARMKDTLIGIYNALSSIQVLVCDAFHVFVLVYPLLSGRWWRC